MISQMVSSGRPVLGVCLGAQLLAKSLGARVYPGPCSEIGYGSVELTADASTDPLFAGCDPEIPVFHWHGDTFTLPTGATLLASSSIYPHQAFRVGRSAYALQFHLEADDETWSAWEPKLPADVHVPAVQRNTIQRIGQAVIGNFFSH